MRAFSCADVRERDRVGGEAADALAEESLFGLRPGFFFVGGGACDGSAGFFSDGRTSGSAEFGGSSGFSSAYGGG